MCLKYALKELFTERKSLFNKKVYIGKLSISKPGISGKLP
jgi:hypothetical protein